MKFLSSYKNSIFIGQSVKFPGSSIYTSLSDVPKSKRLELPVFEDAQMGMSIGLALEGFLPITCFGISRLTWNNWAALENKTSADIERVKSQLAERDMLIEEWGGDLILALSALPTGIWWTALYPGMAMFLLVLGLSFLGDGLESWISETSKKAQ